MNSRQIARARITILVIVLVCLFPPWQYSLQLGTAQVLKPAGYAWLFAPPPPERENVHFGVSIDLSRLLLEILIVIALGGYSVFLGGVRHSARVDRSGSAATKHEDHGF